MTPDPTLQGEPFNTHHHALQATEHIPFAQVPALWIADVCRHGYRSAAASTGVTTPELVRRLHTAADRSATPRIRTPVVNTPADSPTTTTAQAAVTHRDDRITPVYGLLDAPMDLLGGRQRRKCLLAQARGKTLEVGIGTGRNLKLYRPASSSPASISPSGCWPEHNKAASRNSIGAELEIGDVQHLPSPMRHSTP